MAQLGHTDARLTLNVYAQVMQRQRVDEDVIWQLMRFPDEAEMPLSSRSFGPRIGPLTAEPSLLADQRETANMADHQF